MVADPLGRELVEGDAVAEAAALGVPTVAYDVEGLRDAVRDGQTGWLVAASTSEIGFERFQYFLGSAVGLFLLFCWSLALVFHLMTGLRML